MGDKALTAAEVVVLLGSLRALLEMIPRFIGAGEQLLTTTEREQLREETRALRDRAIALTDKLANA